VVSSWRTWLLGGVCLVLLILLHPRRELRRVAEDRGVVEIVYMGPGGPISGAMEEVVREFEKRSREAHRQDSSKPLYKVVSGQNAARDQVSDPTRFLVSVAGGMPPDVIWFDRYAVTEWSARGAFEPLDRFIQADQQAYALEVAAARQAGREAPPAQYPHPQRYYKACWDETIYDGKVYGVPVSVDNRALFYNKDLLVRAGLVYADGPHRGEAKPPDTWEELAAYTLKLSEWDLKRPLRPADWDDYTEYQFLLAVIRSSGDPERLGQAWQALGHSALTAAELTYAGQLDEWTHKRKLKVLGFAPNYGNSWLYIYGWMNRGEFLVDERDASGQMRQRCTLNDPRIVAALQYMQDLYDVLGGYETVAGFQRGFQGAELDPLIVGTVVMKIDGVWILGGTLAPFGPDLNFGVAPPPVPRREFDQGYTMSWTGGWALAIPATAKHKEAAWEFIRFFCSDTGIRLQVEAQRRMTEAQGRLYMPSQDPVVHLNQEFFERYVRDNPRIPPRFATSLQTFNDLLPYSRFRPVTPVGQKLWNAHRDAMESALYGQSPQEALDYQTAIVQRELDRFFRPPQGRLISSWYWFFILYGALLIGTGLVVFYWDTHAGFRRRTARLLFWRHAEHDGVIEGSQGGYFRRRWWEGWVCVLPWIIGFGVFGGGPMLYSIVMSFCDYDVINPARYIGAGNYRWMVQRDEIFWISLRNTGYMVLGVPIGMAVSLAVALLLNLKIRGMAAWRTLFYLPAIVPMVASSILWIWIFNPEQGFLNQALRTFLHLQGPRWLDSVEWAKPSLLLMGLWGAGAGMIIWLAGLKGIPQSLYEAAAVDGASAWQRFRYITIPQLTPYIFFNLVMGLIGTFQIFGQAFIMTQGGPKNATLFYVYHLFNNAFRYGAMGYASAMAWVLFVVVLALTIVNLRLSKRWVHYESE